jgi:anti-anti-sigma factor
LGVAQRFHIEVQQVPDGVKLVLSGSADIAAADAMQRQFLPIAAQKPRRVTVDLSGLDLISSIAMGALVQFHHGVRQHGGEVVLCGASGVVLDSLRRAQLDRMIKVVQ